MLEPDDHLKILGRDVGSEANRVMLSSANDRVSAGDGLRLWFWRVATVMMTGTSVAAWSQSDPSTAAPTPAPTPLPSAASPATPTFIPVGPVDLHAMGHVPQRRLGGEGGDDRAALRLGRDLDGLARQDDRAPARPGGGCAARWQGSARSLDGEAAEQLAAAQRGRPALRRAAITELQLSADGMERDGIKERVASRLERIEAGIGRRISRGTGVLATIGATAPFVGLFGTVWGIMNSFIGISKAQTTNLAVVAPGIAEALLATAFGLVAAIPAVVIYNVFARQIAGYRALLGDASAEVLRLVSRDLDRRAARAPRRASCGGAAVGGGVAAMSVRLDHGDDALAEVHEINVTPFIDVMLVLLIIFMVAAPLATVDIPVNLPASTAEPQPVSKRVYVTVRSDLTLAIGNNPVPRNQFQTALNAATNGDHDTHIFLRGDKNATYGDVVAVTDMLLAANYRKIVLVGVPKISP